MNSNECIKLMQRVQAYAHFLQICTHFVSLVIDRPHSSRIYQGDKHKTSLRYPDTFITLISVHIPHSQKLSASKQKEQCTISWGI